MALGISTLGAVLIAWAALLALLLAWLWLRSSRTRQGDWAGGETAERRRGKDRRTLDIGPPPGVPDRRSGVDRRRRGLTAAG